LVSFHIDTSTVVGLGFDFDGEISNKSLFFYLFKWFKYNQTAIKFGYCQDGSNVTNYGHLSEASFNMVINFVKDAGTAITNISFDGRLIGLIDSFTNLISSKNAHRNKKEPFDTMKMIQNEILEEDKFDKNIYINLLFSLSGKKRFRFISTGCSQSASNQIGHPQDVVVKGFTEMTPPRNVWPGKSNISNSVLRFQFLPFLATYQYVEKLR